MKKEIDGILADHPDSSAARVRIRLKDRAKRENREVKLPSERTIARYKKKFQARPPEEQWRHRSLSWPESFMGQEGLPLEASRSCLDFLGWLKHNRLHFRPSNEDARWFWRVTEAAPDAPTKDRWEISVVVRDLPLLHKKVPAKHEAIEGFLAFRPWASPRHAAAYALAVKETGLPRYTGGIQYGPESEWLQEIDAAVPSRNTRKGRSRSGKRRDR